MLRVGLTGGLACGKSTVAKMMAERGACVVYADEIAHELMRPGQPVYHEVVKHFGPDIVEPDGSISRAKLADAAFGSGRVEELNRIVHPAVVRHQDEWMAEMGRKDPAAITVVEAALIFEAGVEKRFDRIVVVTCRAEQKAERLGARLQLGVEEARAEVARRAAAQWPDEKKIQAAHHVLDNSGSLADLERQVDALMSELRKLAAAR